MTDGHGGLSTLDLFQAQDQSPFEDPRKGQEPAPFNVAVCPPPAPRQLTRRPSREQIVHALVEATAQVSRLGALLAATPEPDATEEPSSK